MCLVLFGGQGEPAIINERNAEVICVQWRPGGPHLGLISRELIGKYSSAD